MRGIGRILAAALSCGLAAGLAAGKASAQEPIALKLSAPVPSGSAVCDVYFKRWAAKIEKESNGRLKPEVFCDSILSKVGDTYDRVEAGIADVGWDIYGQYGKRFSSLSVAALPGLFGDDQLPQASAAMWLAYEEGLIGKEFGNFKVLWFNATGNGQFFLRSAPESSSDFKGMKVAVGNATRAKLTKALGGVPLSLSVNDYYTAVQKGAADGVMTSMAAVVSRALHEVTHHFISGPFGGGVIVVVMNKAKYESLPPDLKRVIDDNSGYAQSRLIGQEQVNDEASELKKALAFKGNKQVALTKEEVAKLGSVFDALIAEYASTAKDADKSVARLKELIAKELAK